MVNKTKACKLKKAWIKAELEHAHLFPKPMQLKMAKKIAQDHIKESGCGYYPELFKMEKRLRRKKW